MRIVLIILLVLTKSLGQCQIGFKKFITLTTQDIYGLDLYYSFDFDGISLVDSFILLSGNIKHENDLRWSSLIMKLDTFGNPIWMKTFNDSSGIQDILTNTPCDNLIEETYKTINIPVNYFQTNTPGLIQLDYSGNFKNKIILSNEDRSLFLYQIMYYDKYFYVFGNAQRNNYLNDIIVYKLDYDYNLVWKKYFGRINEDDYFGNVRKNNDGTFTVISASLTSTFFYEDQLNGWAWAKCTNIDTTGTDSIEWVGQQSSSSIYGNSGSIKDSQGNWHIIGTDYTENTKEGELSSRVKLVKADKNGEVISTNILTDFNYQFSTLIDIEYDSLNEEIILAGNIYVDAGGEYLDSEVWLLKSDNYGNIIYEKSDTLLFGFPGNERHFIAGVELSNSGSIYIAGNVHTYKNDGFIIKYNKDGCWDTICTTTSIGNIVSNQFGSLLYPNPVAREINIYLPNNLSEYFLSVYDISGKAVLIHKCNPGLNIIQVDLKTGYYFYRIDQNNMFFRSGQFYKY